MVIEVNTFFCGCGCGKEIPPGRMYANGGCALRAGRERKKSPEHCAKIGISQVERNIRNRIDGARGKVCPACGEYKTEEAYGIRPTKNSLGIPHLKSWCRECERKKPNPKLTPEYQRNHHLKWKYGITQEQYEQMLEAQGGVCAVCGSDSPGNRSVKHFHVDHCHGTGRIRGLLCNGCNTAIGSAKETPWRLRALADYVEVHLGHVDPAHKDRRPRDD